MKLMCLVALTLTLLVGFGSAEDILDGNYSISIPEGWYIAENNTDKTILSDNISAIRIDMTTISNLELSQMILGNIQDVPEGKLFLGANTSDPEFYKIANELTPWVVSSTIRDYYVNRIYNMSELYGGAGLPSAMPKDIEYASVFTNMNGSEWCYGWLQDEKMVGVHAIFNQEYESLPFNEGYYTDEYIKQVIPKPLYDVITSFHRKGADDIVNIV